VCRLTRHDAAIGFASTLGRHALCEESPIRALKREENGVMKVEQLMTKEPHTCAAEDALAQAARIMWEHDCGCVPVLAGPGSRRLAGIVTDRDLCMAAYTQGRPLWEIPVRSVMATEPWTCHPDDALRDALRIMRHRQVRRLPVVDAQGNLLGLLSLSDVAVAVRDAAAAQAARRRAKTHDDAGDAPKGRSSRAALFGVGKSDVADTLAEIGRLHVEPDSNGSAGLA
jgi:CBS domain-containing protein